MFKKRDRNEIRVIRHARVRKKISGTPETPRLSVYRSNKHIQAQIIDDTKGVTLVSASTMDPALKGQLDEVVVDKNIYCFALFNKVIRTNNSNSLTGNRRN